VPKDSVLVGLIGQGRTRGMVAKLSIESTINQNLAAIVPLKGYSGDFIHQYLFKEYNRLRNVGRGSNQGALNCQIVRGFKIIIPKQYKEQEIISKTLLVIDERIKKEKILINKLQKQKSGLMQDLLTGKVEVTVQEKEVVHAG
jgi:type I restriction enzyme S subunit